jgi:enamine deaminase RidA (YjgF/YER057c/UK114 family)
LPCARWEICKIHLVSAKEFYEARNFFQWWQVGTNHRVLENGEGRGFGVRFGKTLANVRRALELAGAKPEHVVRSTIFLQNIDDWEAVGRAHGEVFGAIRPAATMIEVSRFIAPEMLIEIQVDAVMAD